MKQEGRGSTVNLSVSPLDQHTVQLLWAFRRSAVCFRSLVLPRSLAPPSVLGAHCLVQCPPSHSSFYDSLQVTPSPWRSAPISICSPVIILAKFKYLIILEIFPSYYFTFPVKQINCYRGAILLRESMAEVPFVSFAVVSNALGTKWPWVNNETFICGLDLRKYILIQKIYWSNDRVLLSKYLLIRSDVYIWWSWKYVTSNLWEYEFLSVWYPFSFNKYVFMAVKILDLTGN